MRMIKLVFLGQKPNKRDEEYKVITVKNTTEYVPGEILMDKEVDSLCESPKWDVVIVGALKDVPNKQRR